MELVKVEIDKRKILERLIQLYLHDISYYFPIPFDSEQGMYIYDLEKYFSSTNNMAYFIKENSMLVGFILLDITEDLNIVDEMFILNQNKGGGIGKKAVFQIFDTYKNNWLIKALPLSKPAENFWNKTIKEYTKDNYQIERIGKYDRAVFSFRNK